MIANPYWRSPGSWVGMPWGLADDNLVFGAIVTYIPSFAMSTYLFSTVQLRSLLMEPGAKLFQPMGGLAGVPTEAQHREFIRSL